jgi:hypothetical protein
MSSSYVALPRFIYLNNCGEDLTAAGSAGDPVRRGFSVLSLTSTTVIASEAKQSSLSLRGEMDCFASLAMTGRQNTPPPSRGAFRPGFANRFAQEKRAQGTPGACCTRGLACKKQ